MRLNFSLRDGVWCDKKEKAMVSDRVYGATGKQKTVVQRATRSPMVQWCSSLRLGPSGLDVLHLQRLEKIYSSETGIRDFG